VYRVVIAINHTSQRPEFIDRSVNARFVLDAVALGQVFLRDSLASVIKQMFSTLICILTLMFSERKTRETWQLAISITPSQTSFCCYPQALYVSIENGHNQALFYTISEIKLQLSERSLKY
jgi:hypothetical protein